MEISRAQTRAHEWTLEALKAIAADPKPVLRRSEPKDGTPDEYLSSAVRAFAGTYVGVSDREAALAVVDSLEHGCPTFSHFSSDITSAHSDLTERTITALANLTEKQSSRERINFVQTLLDRGDFENAAVLFAATVRDGRSIESTLESARQKAEREGARLDRKLAQLGRTADEAAARAKEVQSKIAVSSDSAAHLSRTVSAVSAEELSSAYSTQFETDKSTAIVFQKSTFGFLSLGLVSAFVFLVLSLTDKVDQSTENSLAHLSVTATLFVLAGYSGRLSREYRRAMWHWKHTALQIQEFFPFIDRLPIDDQTRVVVEMTPRFFPGQPKHPTEESSTSSSETNSRADSANSRVTGANIQRSLR